MSLMHKKEVMWKQSREMLKNAGLEDWSCIATIQEMPATIRTWKRQGMDGLGRTSRWGQGETYKPSQILSGYVHFYIPRNMLKPFKIPYIHSISHIFLMSFWSASLYCNRCLCIGQLQNRTTAVDYFQQMTWGNGVWPLWALNEILKELSLWLGFSVSWVKWWLFWGHGSFGDTPFSLLWWLLGNGSKHTEFQSYHRAD